MQNIGLRAKPLYNLHLQNIIPARRTSLGLRYSLQDDIQEFGATLYYGITPALTGRIYGGIRLIDEGEEPRAFNMGIPPSPGFGAGLSYRDFPNSSNIGYWASAYAGLRYVRITEGYDATYMKGEGRSAGFGAGLLLKIPTPSYTMLPLAGLTYADSGVSGKPAFVDISNESYSDLFGVLGIEVTFNKAAVLCLASVPIGGGEWDFSISSYLRPQ